MKKLDSSMEGKSYLSTSETAIINMASASGIALETEGPPRKRSSYNSLPVTKKTPTFSSTINYASKRNYINRSIIRSKEEITFFNLKKSLSLRNYIS